MMLFSIACTSVYALSFLLLSSLGSWGIVIISVCLSVHSHLLLIQYLIKAPVEKSDMLPNYAPWGGLDACWKGMTMTYFAGVKIGLYLEIIWRGVNAISRQSKGREWLYAS